MHSHSFSKECHSKNILVDSAVSFVSANDDVYLSSYRESYFNKANHDDEIPSRIRNLEDFGNIAFEDVSTDFFNDLRSK